MGRDFTFLNETGENISVVHTYKNTRGETFKLENGESKTIQLDNHPETSEKYWLYSSTGESTQRYVDSDDYEKSKQVTFVKDGDNFALKFLARVTPINRIEEWTTKLKSSLSWSKNQESGTLPVTRPSTSGGTNR